MLHASKKFTTPDFVVYFTVLMCLWAVIAWSSTIAETVEQRLFAPRKVLFRLGDEAIV